MRFRCRTPNGRYAGFGTSHLHRALRKPPPRLYPRSSPFGFARLASALALSSAGAAQRGQKTRVRGPIMRTLVGMSAVVALAFFAVGCGSDENSITQPEPTTTSAESKITADQTPPSKANGGTGGRGGAGGQGGAGGRGGAGGQGGAGGAGGAGGQGGAGGSGGQGGAPGQGGQGGAAGPGGTPGQPGQPGQPGAPGQPGQPGCDPSDPSCVQGD